jgi:hypothetical protein
MRPDNTINRYDNDGRPAGMIDNRVMTDAVNRHAAHRRQAHLVANAACPPGCDASSIQIRPSGNFEKYRVLSANNNFTLV